MSIPPRRPRPLSVARAMSGRAAPPADGPKGAEAITGLIGGLGRLLQGLESAVREASAGTTDAEKRVVLGYSLKVGPLGAASAEPFGDIAPAPHGDAPAAREPIVDIHEEADAILVVAELPGAEAGGVVARVEPDGTLLIESAGPRAYRKRVALPGPVDAAGLSLTCRNGILEVRLPRAAGTGQGA